MSHVGVYFVVLLVCGCSMRFAESNTITDVRVSSEFPSHLNISWSSLTNSNFADVSYMLVDRYQCGNSIPTQPKIQNMINVTDNSIILEDLEPNSLYEVNVTIYDKRGGTITAEISETGSTISGPVPGPGILNPTSISSTATTLEFEWTGISCEQAQGRVSDYIYKLTTRSSATLVKMSTISETSVMISSDLISCETYNFEVAVVRTDGTQGNYSSPIPARTSATVPGPVTNLGVKDSSSAHITLSWNPPSQKTNCQITYLVEFRLEEHIACIGQDQGNLPESFTEVEVGTSNTEFDTQANLEPYSNYLFRVYAAEYDPVNDITKMHGEMKDLVAQTTQSAPSKSPTNINVDEVKSRSLTFSWKPLKCQDLHGGFSHYQLALTQLDNSKPDSTQTNETDRNMFTFSDLIPFTRYKFTVRAVTNGNLKGPPGEISDTLTAKDVPGRPLGLMAGQNTTNSVEIKWSPPKQRNGILLEYFIQYKVIENPFKKMFNLSESEVSQNETVDHKESHDVFSHNISDLNHGCSIEVHIWAKNDAEVADGIGDSAKAKLSTKVEDPDIDFIDINIKEVNDSSNQFMIEPKSRSVAYQKVSEIWIVVNTNSRQTIDRNMLQNWKKSKEFDLPYYIVRSFTSESFRFPSDVIIGDNTTTNEHDESYFNPSLNSSLVEETTVHVGYVFDIIQGKMIFISDGVLLLPKPTTAALDVTEQNLAVIFGGVIAVILILLVVVIIAWKTGLLRKPEKNNKNPQAGQGSAFSKELESIVARVAAPETAVYEKFKIGEEIYQVPEQAAPVKRKPPSSATLARSLKMLHAPTVPRRQKRGEVPWSYFHVLDKQLGKGAFGEVCLGYVWADRLDTWQQAAIKTMKPNAPNDEVTAFNEEFKMMQKIGFNKNVICLLAASYDDENILHVAIEFAPHGNLRRFLRRYRKARQRSQQQGALASGHDDDFIPELTLQQLLLFALEVIDGMLHLVKKQVIHRDLAARNVLLGDDNGKLIAKVADFGLARENIYTKSNKRTRLATRWQAIESLSKGQYSHQSDVWGFGILLWEIITLGSTPYENFERRDIINFLDQGHRMPKPEGCSHQIYNLMSTCWHSEPHLRPTFADLKKRVKNIMNQEDQPYVNWSLDTQIVEARDDD